MPHGWNSCVVLSSHLGSNLPLSSLEPKETNAATRWSLFYPISWATYISLWASKNISIPLSSRFEDLGCDYSSYCDHALVPINILFSVKRSRLITITTGLTKAVSFITSRMPLTFTKNRKRMRLKLTMGCSFATTRVQVVCTWLWIRHIIVRPSYSSFDCMGHQN